MTTLAVAAGFLAWNRWGAQGGLLATGMVLLGPFSPLLAAPILWRRFRRPPQPDVTALTRLLGVAIGAGLSLGPALRHASALLDEATKSEVELLLRRAQAIGLGPALASTSGPLGPLARRLAGAHRSGASMSSAIDGLEREAFEETRAQRMGKVRRLPVQLTIPLVLLILPGSVLLLVGPGIVEQLMTIVDPLGPLP